ncbi:RagB/SusD family nutrient uptake outer membrane protein [Carboxylicivirga sp. A043]|uniref:RagB/SusD family nutrient uptake outer membrane protein n=1 Tax=Carboxylicivirga litoralis TaxID=2816963 RepID=UPI0021CB533E|nr:RagB/SusD family nutrient uptake outer membrane protein [Carboxylicivirga sp. A043]MCU4157810.1 RagB/SusD family nutrient uptake outer membrane protein [Carboxylicivirga sp. A043]
MKKKLLYMLVAPALLLFAGCEDNLDTLPEGDVVTTGQKEDVYSKDPSKASAGVTGIYAQFSQYAPNEDDLNRVNHHDIGYPSLMMFSDANGTDVVQEDNGYNWTTSSLEYSDRTYTSRECQIIWNNQYRIISNCNNVIGAIDPATEDPTSKYYLSQGLATRAFSYWTLAQLFQFNYVGNESKPCVPIVTHENATTIADEGAKRNTVQEVYDFIMTDINTAVSLLTDAEAAGVKRDDKRYMNLAVAYGLRARFNLTMHKYAEAAADASSAIDISDATPASIEDISKPAFWTVDEANWMWGILIAETDRVVTSGIVNWISHMGSLNYGYANYNKGRQINKKLYAKIGDSDARKGWWIDENKQSPNLSDEFAAAMASYGYKAYTQVKFAPYKNEAKTSTNSNDIPLMRIEEMYLIKAEAEAMSGGDGKTTLESFIQTYRDPDYVCEATSPEGIQEEVFDQRRIELWGEGLSWYDIMRLNKGVDRRGAGYPNATMVFNIPAGDPVLIWRLPEAEIQANPALTESDNNPSAPDPQPVPDVD